MSKIVEKWIADNAVATAKIADDAVTAAKLGSVTGNGLEQQAGGEIVPKLVANKGIRVDGANGIEIDETNASTAVSVSLGTWTFVPAALQVNGAPSGVNDAVNKSYVDTQVAGLLDYKGGYAADTNTPDLDTSPSGVLKGDMYTVTTAGNFFTEAVEAGDVLIAEVDSASALADWTVVQSNLTPATIKTQYESNADTNAFTDADETKLDGIEALADVTDAANVDAAGATMNTDTTLVGNGYFLDDDTMAADDATKVPSQQSVKAYVDNATAGISTENKTVIYHVITGGEDSAGFFTLGTAIASGKAASVEIEVINGIGQSNKQTVGATGATPDFDVAVDGANTISINDTAAATGLSGDMGTGDILRVSYVS